MIKRLVLTLALLTLLLPACAPAGIDYDCAATLQALQKLRKDLEDIPAHLLVEPPVEDGTEFDPNSYMEVFEHLSLQEGFVLDFVYTYDYMGGYPTMYARETSWGPFLSQADVRPGMDNYLDHIQVDDTPEGYLQYVMLAVMAEQFYLHWHANYNDMQVVCSHNALEDIVRSLGKGTIGIPITPLEKAKALALTSIEPQISIEAETVTVKLMTFTKWGGFYRTTFTIDRSFPHFILDVQQELVAPYNCGIAF